MIQIQGTAEKVGQVRGARLRKMRGCSELFDFCSSFGTPLPHQRTIGFGVIKAYILSTYLVLTQSSFLFARPVVIRRVLGGPMCQCTSAQCVSASRVARDF